MRSQSRAAAGTVGGKLATWPETWRSSGLIVGHAFAALSRRRQRASDASRAKSDDLTHEGYRPLVSNGRLPRRHER